MSQVRALHDSLIVLFFVFYTNQTSESVEKKRKSDGKEGHTCDVSSCL